MPDLDKDDLDNRFKYHPPTSEQQAKYEMIRPNGRELAALVIELCPPSRERSLALTKIEEAIMWANASIARRS